MKRTTLLKSLLLATGLLVGSANLWATDVPYNVGTSTDAAYLSAYSDVWEMEGDGVLNVTFTNYNNPLNSWDRNWTLICGNSSDQPSDGDVNTNRYFIMRADRWDNMGSVVAFKISDEYFDDFMNYQNEAEVSLNIVRVGSTVNVYSTITKDAETRTMSFVKTGIEGTAKFYLTGSLSYLTVKSVSQTTDLTNSVNTNVWINFDNFSGEDNVGVASVTGGKGSMTLNTNNFFTAKVADGDYRLALRNASTSVGISSTEYAGSKDIVTVSFDLAMSTQGDNSNNKTIYFYLQDAYESDIARTTITTDKEDGLVSLDNTLGLVGDDIYLGSTIDWSKAVHFTITLDYSTGKIITTTTCSGANNTNSSHTVTMTNTNPVAKFYIGAGYNTGNINYKPRFDNLLIQTTKGDYNTTANITLSFKDNEDNDISELYTGTTAFTPEKGSTFTPSDYYPTVMYNGDYKYTYASGGDAFEVTADQDIELIYNKSDRPTYTVNVTANYGAKNKTIVNAETVKEGADYTYYYPRFILDGTTLYEYDSSTDLNASDVYWTSTLSNVAANGNYTLTYNAIEGECVYFSEGEDIEGKTGTYTYGDWRGTMSNGSTGVYENATLTSLEPGVYSVTGRAVGRADRYINISNATGELIKTLPAGNSGSTTTFSVTIPTSTTIKISGGNTTSTINGHGLDYIFIMKSSDLPLTEQIAVTTVGYATYVSDYNLDFSEATTKAYKVSVAEKGVATLTEVAQVPAKTPVLLYCKGGNGEGEQVAITTDAVETVDGNDLVAGTGAAVATTVDGYTNMILNNVGGNVGFYYAAGQTVASNRAYLHIATELAPDAADEAPMRIVFADDATAIESVEATEAEDSGVVYNLAGQRVAAPSKGLYIVNGKKILVK